MGPCYTEQAAVKLRNLSCYNLRTKLVSIGLQESYIFSLKNTTMIYLKVIYSLFVGTLRTIYTGCGRNNSPLRVGGYVGFFYSPFDQC